MPTPRMMCLAALLTLAPPLAAQPDTPSPRLTFGARVGAAVPLGDFADAAGTGLNLGIDAGYAVLPPLSVYAGYRYTNYPLELTDWDEITLQGPILGLALYRPNPDDPYPDDGPPPLPWEIGAHLGVSLLNVDARRTDDAVSGSVFGVSGGVRVGVNVGGVGIAAYWDGDICPPWRKWPPKGPGPGPSPPPEFATKIGMSFTLRI